MWQPQTRPFGFWILDFGSWILDFGSWILDFWILDFGFWILDFGFWISDFGDLDFVFTERFGILHKIIATTRRLGSADLHAHMVYFFFDAYIEPIEEITSHLKD